MHLTVFPNHVFFLILQPPPSPKLKWPLNLPSRVYITPLRTSLSLSTIMRLSCNHKIQKQLANKNLLHLDDIHSHWHLVQAINAPLFIDSQLQVVNPLTIRPQGRPQGACGRNWVKNSNTVRSLGLWSSGGGGAGMTVRLWRMWRMWRMWRGMSVRWKRTDTRRRAVTRGFWRSFWCFSLRFLALLTFLHIH